MFGKILRELRSQKKITQTELAQAIGVSNGNVGDWERGRSKPGYDALAALSRYFEISAEYLLELDVPSDKKSDDHICCEGEKPLCDDSPLTDEETDLVAMYRRLPSYAREDMFDQVHCLYRKYAERKKESIYWTYKEDKLTQKNAAADDDSQGGIA